MLGLIEVSFILFLGFRSGCCSDDSVVLCYTVLRQYAFSGVSEEHISAFFTTNFIALHT
jgi:hypothetical protein